MTQRWCCRTETTAIEWRSKVCYNNIKVLSPKVGYTLEPATTRVHNTHYSQKQPRPWQRKIWVKMVITPAALWKWNFSNKADENQRGSRQSDKLAGYLRRANGWSAVGCVLLCMSSHFLLLLINSSCCFVLPFQWFAFMCLLVFNVAPVFAALLWICNLATRSLSRLPTYPKSERLTERVRLCISH